MSDGVKLKACPLCGREPEINRHAVFQIHCTQTYPGQHIVCVTERTEAEAIAAWNTRKSDDGWRTMESAPKDGVPFLAWIDFEGGCPDMHAIVSWNGENETWHYNGAYAYGGCREGFFVKNWRPLPSPPEG